MLAKIIKLKIVFNAKVPSFFVKKDITKTIKVKATIPIKIYNLF